MTGEDPEQNGAAGMKPSDLPPRPPLSVVRVPVETASLPPTSTLPKAKLNGHSRNVSWGNEEVGWKSPKRTDVSPKQSPKRTTNSSDLDIPDLSPKSGITNPGNITLDDVLRAHPYESEAESYIINALEQRGVVNAEPSVSLLGAVTNEGAKMFAPEAEVEQPHVQTVLSNESEAVSKSSLSKATDNELYGRKETKSPRPSNRSAPHTPNHSRHDTLQSTLKGLADALADYKDMQMSDLDLSSPTPVEIIATTDSPSAASQRRKKSEDTTNDERNATTAQDAGQGPKESKWGVLKSAVQNTTVEELAKKNDGPIQEVRHDIETGVEKANTKREEAGSNERKAKAHHMKVVALATDFASKLRSQTVAKDFETFVAQRKNAMIAYLRLLCLLVLPATAVAFILFYISGNPPTGVVDLEASRNGTRVNTSGGEMDPRDASASWWILFICVRQAVTYTGARAIQAIIIDFFCLNTRIFINIFGDLFTLLIILSKGWPFVFFVWGLLDLGTLCGDNELAKHWLFFQDHIGLFNYENPNGNIPDNEWNRRLLVIAVCVAVVVAVKRLYLSLYLGRKTFTHYAQELSKVMKKIVLLYEVAALSRKVAREAATYGPKRQNQDFFYPSEWNFVDDGDDTATKKVAEGIPASGDGVRYDGTIVDPTERDGLGGLSEAQKIKLSDMLGQWEEPTAESDVDENISISAILQFRQSLSFLQENRFLFSIAWGNVESRENMVVSSQEVFKRLCLREPDNPILHFETIAEAALMPDGSLDPDKVKDLIKLLRPSRQGDLTLLEFVKGVDTVYKEARVLRAAIRNSEKIDRSLVLIINVPFYGILVSVILSQLGFDPLSLYLSLSSIILGFAFMFGSAAAKMFEGVLLIMVQRPYDIGDRINIAAPQSEASRNGSAAWIVKNVNLFSTTAVYAMTGEKATFSNGALAQSRIINQARSPRALIYIDLKFPIDVPYDKIEIYKQALRGFIQARPREFGSLFLFRATDIMVDQGYIGYIVILQSVNPWQSAGLVYGSKAEVASFCHELSKKLDMRYVSPSLPVDLALVSGDREAQGDGSILTKQQDQAPGAGGDKQGGGFQSVVNLAMGLSKGTFDKVGAKAGTPSLNEADVQAVAKMFEKSKST